MYIDREIIVTTITRKRQLYDNDKCDDKYNDNAYDGDDDDMMMLIVIIITATLPTATTIMTMIGIILIINMICTKQIRLE